MCQHSRILPFFYFINKHARVPKSATAPKWLVCPSIRIAASPCCTLLKEYTACFERIRTLERQKKRDIAPEIFFDDDHIHFRKVITHPSSVLLNVVQQNHTRVATVVGQGQNPERKPKGAMLFL